MGSTSWQQVDGTRSGSGDASPSGQTTERLDEGEVLAIGSDEEDEEGSIEAVMTRRRSDVTDRRAA